MIFTVLQLLVGIFSGIGLCLILLDLYRVPTMKTARAAGNLGKKGNRKVGVAEISAQGFLLSSQGKSGSANTARQVLRQICGRRAWIPRPEGYVADRHPKHWRWVSLQSRVLCGKGAVACCPCDCGDGLVSGVPQGRKKIRTRRTRIEYELPRLVGTVEKTMQHSHDVIYMLDSYRAHAGKRCGRSWRSPWRICGRAIRRWR